MSHYCMVIICFNHVLVSDQDICCDHYRLSGNYLLCYFFKQDRKG